MPTDKEASSVCDELLGLCLDVLCGIIIRLVVVEAVLAAGFTQAAVIHSADGSALIHAVTLFAVDRDSILITPPDIPVVHAYRAIDICQVVCLEEFSLRIMFRFRRCRRS